MSARPINEITGIKKRSSVLVRGMSHMELSKLIGAIPQDMSEEEYVEWAKGPRGYSTFELWTQEPGNEGMTLEDFFEWLGFVEATTATELMAAITASQAACAASATAAAGSATTATTQATNAANSATAANTAKVAAEAAQAAAEAAASSFNAATASDIWTGSNTTKFVNSVGLKNAAAFVARTAGELSGTTVTYDMTLGQNRSHTLTVASTTFAAPTNLQDGVTYCWKFKQDGTGNRAVVLNAIFDFGAAGAPTFSTGANKVDRIFGTYDATENKIVSNFHKAA